MTPDLGTIRVRGDRGDRPKDLRACSCSAELRRAAARSKGLGYIPARWLWIWEVAVPCPSGPNGLQELRIVVGPDSDHATAFGQSLEHIVRQVAMGIHHGAGSRVGGYQGLGRCFQGIPHGLIRAVGNVHQDPQTVALTNHLESEVLQAEIIVVHDSHTGIRPLEGEAVNQLQLPEAQTVIESQGGQILEGDTTVQPNQERQFSLGPETIDILARQGHRYLLRLLGHCPVDGIQLPEKPLAWLRRLRRQTDS